MTDKEKQALIYRVVSGYTVIGNYIIDTPDDSLINESLAVRDDIIRKYRFEGLLSEDRTEYVLMQKQLWTPTNAANLKELDKALDDCKFELYENYGMPPTQVKKIRDRLELIKNKKAEQLNIRHSLDRYTIEGLADYAAELHVFSKAVLDLNYQRITVPSCRLERLIKKYKQSWPTSSQMRLVARTEPWRSFWGTNEDCFRVLGDEQKVLILFSKMYDNVYEHPDKPVDDIINDDDMLDGWFIHMKRKSQEVRQENTKNAVIQKHPKADTIFMMAQDDNHIKEINNMNDMQAKVIKGQREEILKHKQLVRDKDVPALNIGR